MPDATKKSLLDKLTNFLYLDYVLKVAGIALFALGMFNAWKQVGLGTRFLFFAGPAAWFVGARFTKIYR